MKSGQSRSEFTPSACDFRRAALAKIGKLNFEL